MRTLRSRVVVAAVSAAVWFGCTTEIVPGGDPSGDGGAVGEGGLAGDGGLRGSEAVAPLPSHGATVALTPDDARLVAVNREAGTATVFAVTWPEGAAPGAPTLEKLAELSVGREPSQVVVHPGGDHAFVLSRVDQKLVRIDGLKGTPSVGPSVAVGSEPTGLALTPRGSRAWVANWIDGTVLEIDTADLAVLRTVDLNAALHATGLLGEGAAARPAVSHPRSVAITNNLDKIEEDESVWVTEFYAQQKTPLAPDGANADTAKVGIVYRISIQTGEVKVVELPAMADMGFKDHKGGTAGCFPNQLLSLQLQGAFGYVLSTCASPKGPQGVFAGPANATCTVDATCPGGAAGSCAAGRCATNCTEDAQCGANGGTCVANVCAGNVANVKTSVAPVVSILDLNADKAIANVNLAKEFEAEYVKRGVADDANRRYPLTATDIGFVPGTVTAYVPSRGTDAVFKIDFNATYEASTVDAVGDPKAPFINLVPAGVDPSRTGKLPTGLSVAHKVHGEGAARYAFVANEATRNVAVLDLAAQEIAGRGEGVPNVVASTDAPADPEARARAEGLRLFATGLGRWSLKGQGWASCESCHVDGLSDNVTWFFPRGPRQPNALDGTFASKDPTDLRINNWTAIQDEITDHEMGALRGTAGGVGAIVKDLALAADARIPIDRIGHAGLGGSSRAAADPANPASLATPSVNDDWTPITKFFQSIRSPRRPSNLDAAKVARGKQVFVEGNCQGCHGGAKWTLSKVFYAPDWTNQTNAALKTASWSDEVTASGFPSALLPAQTPAARTMRYGGAAGGDFDQLVCALRPVGTFGVADPAVGVAELRRDMATKAQGDEPDGRGFNPPSLLSMTVGSPYLHAGQVATLEGLLGARFAAHREALAPGFLAEGSPERSEKLAALVQYLLSIDEDAETVDLPALGAAGGTFCKAP